MTIPTQPGTASSAGSTYDETPYPSSAFPQTHPDKLCAMARLFGLDAPAPAEARVLELGCADGSNLLPMAQHAPGARFVGIDASARQVKTATDAIAAAGLRNVEILQQDILDFPTDGEKFDYIIAHGIFSWVPSPVRDRLLAICRGRLSENGVAFVSYNALPGWSMRLALRDMMQFHTRGLKDSKQKVRQARALTAFLAESVATNGNPYGMQLKQELDSMGRYSDNYLRHDILEETNQPFYFHEFMSQARAAGLQYLSEPSIEQMLAANLPEKVRTTLAKVGGDMVAKEQYMDFVRNRNFRQTLLCRGRVRLQRNISPAGITRFFFSSTFEPVQAATIDLSPGVAQAFKLRKTKGELTSPDPLIKAAFAVLAQNGLRRMSFPELLAAAQQLSAPYAAQGSEKQEAALAQNLMQLYVRGIVDIFADRPDLLPAPPAKPSVTPLLRYQALNSPQLTNRLHMSVPFDNVARYVVAACDGTRDRRAILGAVLAKVKSGKLTLGAKDQPVPLSRAPAVAARAVDFTLNKMATLGYFAA